MLNLHRTRRSSVVGKAEGHTVGHFDGVRGYRASGWVADLNAPEQTLEVEFFRVAPDGRSTHLGRTRANRPRVDLQAIGLKLSRSKRARGRGDFSDQFERT